MKPFFNLEFTGCPRQLVWRPCKKSKKAERRMKIFEKAEKELK